MPAVGSSNMNTLGSMRDEKRDFELALIAMRERRRRHMPLVRKANAFEDCLGLLDEVAAAVPDPETATSPHPARLCTARRTFSSADKLGKQVGELEGAAQSAAWRGRRRAGS